MLSITSFVHLVDFDGGDHLRKRRWKTNIKIGFKEKVCEGKD